VSRDDVLRMAREAGFFLYDMHNVDGQDLGESVEADDFGALERFAALVAADARAARIAAQVENEALKARLAASGVAERRAVREAVLAEREACAKVCGGEASRALFSWSSDIPSNRGFWNGAEQIASGCADAIRARGVA
jgi:hypothetical protein